MPGVRYPREIGWPGGNFELGCGLHSKQSLSSSTVVESVSFSFQS